MAASLGAGLGWRANLKVGSVAGTTVAKLERGGIHVRGGTGQAAANANLHRVDLVRTGQRRRAHWGRPEARVLALPDDVPS